MRQKIVDFVVGLVFGLLFFFGGTLGYNPLSVGPLYLLVVVAFLLYLFAKGRLKLSRETFISFVFFGIGYFLPVTLWRLLTLGALLNSNFLL